MRLESVKRCPATEGGLVNALGPLVGRIGYGGSMDAVWVPANKGEIESVAIGAPDRPEILCRRGKEAHIGREGQGARP